MTTLFISDLHLSSNNQEQIMLASNFLLSYQNKLDNLYILGDLFNSWLGDDLIPDKFAPFLYALKQLTQQGTQCFLMVGNRDFMISKTFANQIGCKLLTDPSVIELNGHKTLLIHGDSLCTDDVAYQRYRLWSRNKILQWLFLKSPVKFRQNIAIKIQQKSREQKQLKSAMIMDVNADEVSKVMQDYEVTLLIHGHTHRPAIHQLNNAHRIVLGDWYDKTISFLEYDDQYITLHDHRIQNGQVQLKLD